VVLLKVEQVAGIACHTGRHSCFFQKLEGNVDTGEWVTVDHVLKDLEPVPEKPKRARKLTSKASHE